MRIDDFVCLGRTVPEESKKYGRKVCMAGYSAELNSLVRVYPLPVHNPIEQRSNCVMELERNRQDGRRESWRLKREMGNEGIVNVGEKVAKATVVDWLDERAACSIAALNQSRASLGVIKPLALSWLFKQSDEIVDPTQRTLFDDLDFHFGETATPRIIPYLRFADEGGEHCLQIREWGVHEWLRKEPDKAAQLWDNLRLTSPNQQPYLVIGNMCNCRTSWLVINVFLQEKESLLFDVAVEASA